jgi:hypothetical protein
MAYAKINGVMQDRQSGLAAIAGGELVELRVQGLTLSRPLHALWPATPPNALAAELLAIAAAR